MERINLNYNGEGDTVLYSIQEQRGYSYEKDRESLHQKYGGKQYYTSMSGLSGAGYIEPEQCKNDLIHFGYYYTDKQNQKLENVFVNKKGENVFGYFPLKKHQGIDRNAPVVLTDGENVVFCSQYKVFYFLETWGDWEEKKEITLDYYLISNGYHSEHYKKFYLINQEKYTGVNMLKFVDLREERRKTKECMEGMKHVVKNIYKAEEYYYYYNNKLGIFTEDWKQNPYTIEGSVYHGQEVITKHVIFNNNRQGLVASLEAWGSLRDLVEYESDEIIYTQSDVSVWKYFNCRLDKEAVVESIMDELKRKAIHTLAWKMLDEKIQIKDFERPESENFNPLYNALLKHFGFEVEEAEEEQKEPTRRVKKRRIFRKKED